MKHDGKCKNYHGHRFVVDVTCQAEELDGVGRVIDFSVVKRDFGGWLDEHVDHGMILQDTDPMVQFALGQGLGKDGVVALDGAQFIATPKTLIVPFSPTSENLARFLYGRARALLEPLGVKVTTLRLYETPNCWSDYPARRSVTVEL